MKRNITVPEMGESVSKGTIVDWLKKNGDTVSEGEGLFELETEKASVVVPSAAAGTLEILVQNGTEVAIGQTVAIIESKEGGSPPVPPMQEKPSSTIPAAKPLSPAVRRIVAENRLDPDAIPGTGKGGRITKADALAVTNGQVQSPAAPLNPVQAAPASSPSPSLPASGPQKRVPMTMVRKRTAERLVQARQQAVHVTTFNEIDMSKVMTIRSQHQEAFEKEHKIKIGYMSFFVKACCKALAMHPELNAQIEGDEIVYNNFYDIGIAISLDRGLIVPIIRKANERTFADIEAAIADLATRARNKQLSPDELQGGTFTITNGGVFGSLMSTPVPAFPQVAILGMHAIKKRPVVVADTIVIRPMMYVALTYDHRIVDGREAIGFLVKVKEFIEEPDTLLLEM